MGFSLKHSQLMLKSLVVYDNPRILKFFQVYGHLQRDQKKIYKICRESQKFMGLDKLMIPY